MLPDQEKKIVLLVDDEESVRKLVCLILERAGYRVLLASNSQEALAMSRGYPGQIHLLLSDVDMPGLNGIDLCRQITADRPGTAVLLNSANPFGGDGTEFPFLAKPFTPEKLQMSVAQALAGQPQALAQAEPEALPSRAASFYRQSQIPDTQGAYAAVAPSQTRSSSAATQVQPEQDSAHVSSQAEPRLLPTVVSIRQTAVRERKPRWRATWAVPVWAAAAAALVIVILPFGSYQIRRVMAARPYTVNLQALRGPAAGTEAPTGKPLILNLDGTSLPPADTYKIQIVSEAGDNLWQGVVPAQGPGIQAEAAALHPGVYFVRVYSPAGELLKEFQLHVTRTH